MFGRGQQTDVPLLAGSNSDEGANFPSLRTLAAFQDDARKTLGPFADEFFSLYKADNDAQARKTSELSVRDTRINWPNLQWAKTQARTGHAKVFYYFFPHHPPAPPEAPYVENLGKDLGAYHGAELAYVFGNFVPQDWAWTDADRALAKTVSQYWVNFATNGDPNGPGLPTWPAFNPDGRHRPAFRHGDRRRTASEPEILCILGQGRGRLEGPGVMGRNFSGATFRPVGSSVERWHSG